MGKNQVFFPQETLDGWVLSGAAELSENELWVPAERRRFRLVEAVRVVSEVTGMPDAFEIVGTVRTAHYVFELGAEMLGASMVIGENAYEVVLGWLGAVLDEDTVLAASAPAELSDERLLAQFLARNL